MRRRRLALVLWIAYTIGHWVGWGKRDREPGVIDRPARRV